MNTRKGCWHKTELWYLNSCFKVSKCPCPMVRLTSRFLESNSFIFEAYAVLSVLNFVSVEGKQWHNTEVRFRKPDQQSTNKVKNSTRGQQAHPCIGCAAGDRLEQPCRQAGSQSVIQVDQCRAQSESLDPTALWCGRAVIIIWLDYKLATTA